MNSMIAPPAANYQVQNSKLKTQKLKLIFGFQNPAPLKLKTQKLKLKTQNSKLKLKTQKLKTQISNFKTQN